MFWNYKNTQTWKELVEISPHGRGVLFSDIYPGSISDSKLTEEGGAVYFVKRVLEIMSDCGFSIQELCAVWGVILNRPKQKENDQFAERDISANWDIAATWIHVQRFLGRVRNWGILNSIWPKNRIYFLTSTRQTLAQTAMHCPTWYHLYNLKNVKKRF